MLIGRIALESRIGCQMMVADEVKGGTMQIVGARACDDINGRAVREASCKVEVHGGDLEFLNYLLRKAHGGAAGANGHDAASINCYPRATTAVASGLAQNRHEGAIIAPPSWLLCSGLQLGQLE